VHLGAIVIGTTSSPHKAEIVKQQGAQHVIVVPPPSTDPSAQSFVVQEVLRITNGQGVHGVFDGIGKDTFEDNFLLTRRKGTIVSHGKASGAIPLFEFSKLGAKNLKIVRPR
jgi:NADPH:quinone reductase